MKIGLHSAACAAVFLLAPAAAQALPPVEAFAQLPAMSDPSLSPDGKRLALIQARGGRPVATVWNLEALSTPPMILPFEDGFIDEVRWANDHRLLVQINLNARVWGDDVNPWYRTVTIDPDTKDAAVLFANKQDDRDKNYSASHIVDMAPNDPDHIYMTLWTGGAFILGMYDEPVNSLFRVDVNTGKASSAASGTKQTIGWYMDGAGNPVARLDQTKDPLTHHLLVYTPDKSWREIASTDATGGHGFGIVGLTQDGKALALTAHLDNPSTAGLMQMSLADGKTSPLYFNPIYDIDTDHEIVDPWTSRVLGATVTSHMKQDVYFDAKFQEMQTRLENAFPGLSVHAEAWSLAVDKIVISVDGPVTPPTYYVFDRTANSVKRLGRSYSQLSAGDLGLIRVYDYKARDGLSIPAYLTLPPGKEPKNLPVVILPHGGPMERDSMNFDWESQFLANRGYAVLRPNFRGSSGYGTKFEEAGYGQWGLKMQDDITDGVKKLIADGIADPKRICIVGGSYGGYAALAGVAFTPDLYACAAAWAPVTDLRQFLSTRASDYGRDSWMVSSWTRFIGDRRNDADKLDAASPAENAAKIKVPVLLMHGEADATVRIDQSEIMERALKKAGKKVTFIRMPKETHYRETADTRIRWLTELEKFLKENIGN